MIEIDALCIGGRKIGDWVICLHCGMAYKIGEYRIVHDKFFHYDLQMCPYKDCDGDTVMDAIDYIGQGEPIRGHHYNLDGSIFD